MNKYIIIFNLCFILSTVLIAQNSFYDRDACYPELTQYGGNDIHGIPNCDTCGAIVWNNTLDYKGHCERYIYVPLDTLSSVKTNFLKQNKRLCLSRDKKMFFITDTVTYHGKACMKIYETYYEPKATYIQLIQNGYVPKICEKMPNITDLIVADINLHPSVSRIKNLKRVMIEWVHVKGLKYLKSETLEEFFSPGSQLTEKDITSVISQNPNLKKLTFGLDINNLNQEGILNKVLSVSKKLEYLYILQYQSDSIPSSIFPKMASLKGIRLACTNMATYKGKFKKEDFENIKQIEQFIIEGYSFTNALEILPELTNLEVLEINLDDYKDNKEILQVLKQMPKLKCVQVFSDKTRQKELEDSLPFKNCDCNN